MASKRSARKDRCKIARPHRKLRTAAGGKGRASSPKKNLGAPSRTEKSSTADPLADVQSLVVRGAYGAAIQAAEAVLEANPTYWPAWRSIFSILWHVDRFEDSLRILESALASIPPTDKARGELALLFAQAADKTGLRIQQAIELAEKTIADLGPIHSLVWLIPRLVAGPGRMEDVLAAAARARDLYPDFWQSHFNMSAYLIDANREEEAVASFARILRPYSASDAKSPADNIIEQYAPLARSYGEKALHDSFSKRMADMILDILKTTESMRVLDAGCGTGLLGARIKVARLVGIDLSPDMLAIAHAGGIYDELVEGDIAAAMAARTDTFDIVASSCALYHMADLGFFFQESARLLVSGGYLFFSVDPAPDTMDIGVTPLGEYAHSRAYLRRLAAENGFVEITIKIMLHRASPGFWCAFRCAS